MKQKNIILLIILIIGIVLFLVIGYTMTFILIRPFDGVVTEGRPAMKKLCEMQEKCVSSKVSIQCADDENNFNQIRLQKTISYHGCNESTETYYQQGKYHYVRIESCSCGGLM